ncbi:MAG: hypothetical protein Q7K71_00090 [Candidatus Omnitrophota bacterium]|nr:hypothetical protein [Candidatus Omnitrophota bacterium]
MNKELVVLTAAFALAAGIVFAQTAPEPAVTAEPAVAAEPAAPVVIEAGNKICPLTGRELNLNDPNDYTKMEAEGVSFNVCPKGKAAYDSDSTPFAEKLAKAVAEAKAPVVPAEEDPAEEEEAPAAVPAAAPAPAQK